MLISNNERGMEHADAIDYSVVDASTRGGFNPASPASQKKVTDS